ncbi:subtilase-type protease inhibitor [Streptomyces sp. URMC 123]|uniref:subtilase-type protease inhibitor n=1 Tax=Streptomyces sp. URMC 123 TaxID=3423403 RepID=UPI003F1B29A5
MRTIGRGTVLGVALGLTCLAGGAGLAQAADAPEPRRYAAPNAMVLTVGQGEDPQTAPVRRAVLLSCAPTPHGDHPDPAAACAELRATNGDFAPLTAVAPDRACTLDWNPVTVTAEGVWEGRRVSYAHTFPNSCAKDATESSVFAF